MLISKAVSPFLVAKSYSIKANVRPSVRMSTTFRGKRDFSRPLIEISLHFFGVKIPLINEHLFCKYFVRLSVGNATKGFNLHSSLISPLLHLTFGHENENLMFLDFGFGKSSMEDMIKGKTHIYTFNELDYFDQITALI